MDKIKIKGLRFFAHHGVYAFETENGQDFVVNATLWLDAKEAAKTDELEKSVNYGAVCETIVTFLQEHTYKLLEAAVYHVMKEVMLTYPLIQKIELELCKPQAPIDYDFLDVSVTMEMEWHKAYIALGSNMGERENYIEQAIEKLKQDTDFRNIMVSNLIETKPYGGVEQGDFINGALVCETILSPEELLKRLHEYEAQAERKREIHWGPRTLDLDILFYDELIMDTKDLTIPHADMANRDFVLTPLMELCPYLRHPLTGRTIAEMHKELLNRNKFL